MTCSPLKFCPGGLWRKKAVLHGMHTIFIFNTLVNFELLENVLSCKFDLNLTSTIMTLAEKKLALFRHIDAMTEQEVEQLYTKLVGVKKAVPMRQPVSFRDIKRRFDVVESAINLS
jgi:hypothetical protein